MSTSNHSWWWFRSDLNRKPSTYEVDALTDWATEPYGPDDRIRTCGLLIPNEAFRQTELHPDIGVGDGNRTRVPSLEGWCSTIELHRHISPFPGKYSQPEFHWSHCSGRHFTGRRYVKGTTMNLHIGHGLFSHTNTPVVVFYAASPP